MRIDMVISVLPAIPLLIFTVTEILRYGSKDRFVHWIPVHIFMFIVSMVAAIFVLMASILICFWWHCVMSSLGIWPNPIQH